MKNRTVTVYQIKGKDITLLAHSVQQCGSTLHFQNTEGQSVAGFNAENVAYFIFSETEVSPAKKS